MIGRARIKCLRFNLHWRGRREVQSIADVWISVRGIRRLGGVRCHFGEDRSGPDGEPSRAEASPVSTTCLPPARPEVDDRSRL